MKDPVRLLDAGASELERTLLRAGASEDPPADGAVRLAAALGLSLATATTNTAAAATRASTAPAASASLAPKTAALGAKWLLLSGLALGVAGYAAYRLNTSEPAQQPTAEPHPASVPSSVPVPGSASGSVSGSGSDSVSGSVSDSDSDSVSGSDSVSDSVPKSAAHSAPRQPPPAVPAAHARSIAGEISALDRARSQLASGDSRAALDALDRYRAAFPSGVLQQEAVVLRIEALSRAGERAQAAQLAQRFAREHPSSPHLERIEALTSRGIAPAPRGGASSGDAR